MRPKHPHPSTTLTAMSTIQINYQGLSALNLGCDHEMLHSLYQKLHRPLRFFRCQKQIKEKLKEFDQNGFTFLKMRACWWRY
ncbi:unnamed protein product [Lactuca virosa]|uniref:Uncharacterized protein n=1 Tax=Lactuca virosa TaxID=75947 RepID=A0AAU9MDN7_9ASTR|nr:unnamed protein product [Lactuca virosa]